MAHDIYQGNMAFFGELPWHGIGQRLPQNATIDDVLQAVNFYTAQERPIFASGIDGPLPDRKALVASNDGRYLATVGADYGVVQFSDLYKPLVQELHGQVIWHTAALMGSRGASAFLMAEFPEGLKVEGDKSAYRDFLLLTNAHDGSGRASAIDTSVRVVCRNTMRMALGEGGTDIAVSVRHTRLAAQHVENKFGGLLKTLKSRRETFGRVASFLNGVTVSRSQQTELVDRILPLPTDGKDPSTQLVNNREQLTSLVTGKVGDTTAIAGTAWGLVQATVEYADHYRRNSTEGADKVMALVDGGPANFKAEAFQEALDMLSLKIQVAAIVRVGAAN